MLLCWREEGLAVEILAALEAVPLMHPPVVAHAARRELDRLGIAASGAARALCVIQS